MQNYFGFIISCSGFKANLMRNFPPTLKKNLKFLPNWECLEISWNLFSTKAFIWVSSIYCYELSSTRKPIFFSLLSFDGLKEQKVALIFSKRFISRLSYFSPNAHSKTCHCEKCETGKSLIRSCRLVPFYESLLVILIFRSWALSYLHLCFIR